MNLGLTLLRVFVFPGIIYTVFAAWFILWFDRKMTARMQNRIGPPFYQPFFDFIKLLAKDSQTQQSMEGKLMLGLPIMSVTALIGAATLLPVTASEQGFAGDLVLLVSLLEVPTICLVLAGFISKSIFGQVGATREAILSIAYNIPFLAGMVALASASGSLDLSKIVNSRPGVVGIAAFVSIIICLPAKLHINPFSLSNAEQEIYSGPLTEMSGAQLALWELSHGLEWVALSGLMAALFIPKTGIIGVDIILFLVGSILVSLLLIILSTGSARLKLGETVRLYWRWGTVFAGLVLIASMLWQL